MGLLGNEGAHLLYTHTPTDIAQQIQLLQSRGMSGDVGLMTGWLTTVGYYRLSAYWLPFETPPSASQTRSKMFKSAATFDAVVDLYTFDRKLRLLIMEAIERVEIALRARWTNRASLAHGAHAHIQSSNFACGFEHAKLTGKIAQTVQSSSEVFIEHYRSKYTQPYMPPLWAVTELMTFGELSKWYSATADNSIKQAVAKDLGFPNKETFEGTVQLLAYVRNICAHHGRLWNRRTVKRMPRVRKLGNALEMQRVGTQNQTANSVYNVLTVLAFLLLHQSTDTTFPKRVHALLAGRPKWQLAQMGVPADWQTRDVWRGQVPAPVSAPSRIYNAAKRFLTKLR